MTASSEAHVPAGTSPLGEKPSTQQLLDVSVAYARSATLDDVVRVLFTLGLAPLRVSGAALAVPTPDGARAHLLQTMGYREGVQARWQERTLDTSAPLYEALAGGTAVAVAGQDEIRRRWPAVAGEMTADGVAGLAAWPIDLAGQRLGACLVTFSTPRTVDPGEDAYLQALLALTGQALERARILADRARAEARQLLLQAAVTALSAARSVDDVLDVMTDRMFVASDAHGLMLTLVRGERMVLARHSGYAQVMVDALRDLGHDESNPLAATAQRQQPLFLESPDAYTRQFPHLVHLAKLSDKRAWAMLPLIASGRSLGTWLLSWAEEREFPEAERARLLTLAGLGSQALERARLFDDEHRIATALQQALLPQELPAVDGVQITARYLAGGPAQQVGGDFYDVLCADGSLVLAVGDAAGHDITAAGVMGGVRHSIRAYTVEGHGPTGVMERAHRLLSNGGESFTTCCYLRLDLPSGATTLVTAGHPAPLLLREGAPARQLEAPVSPPLGVTADALVEERTVVLRPGDTLLLFTDGLVERPGRSLGQGLADLLDAAGGHAGAGLDALLDGVLGELGQRPGREDDIALLGVRYTPHPDRHRPDRIARQLDDSARSPAVARRFTSDVLREWDLDDLVDIALLVVSEVVTNAVAHTVGVARIALVRDPRFLRIEVSNSSEHSPRVRQVDDDATSGRGMFIVDALAEEWGIERQTNGKTLWIRLALPGAADATPPAPTEPADALARTLDGDRV